MYTWVHKHAPSRPSTYVCIKGYSRLTRVSGELPQTDTFDRNVWGRAAKGLGLPGRRLWVFRGSQSTPACPDSTKMPASTPWTLEFAHHTELVLEKAGVWFSPKESA